MLTARLVNNKVLIIITLQPKNEWILLKAFIIPWVK